MMGILTRFGHLPLKIIKSIKKNQRNEPTCRLGLAQQYGVGMESINHTQFQQKNSFATQPHLPSHYIFHFISFIPIQVTLGQAQPGPSLGVFCQNILKCPAFIYQNVPIVISNSTIMVLLLDVTKQQGLLVRERLVKGHFNQFPCKHNNVNGTQKYLCLH